MPDGLVAEHGHEWREHEYDEAGCHRHADGLVAGSLLWHDRRACGLLALALLPLELAFWIGFALPLGPVLAVPRTALVLMAWSSLGQAEA